MNTEELRSWFDQLVNELNSKIKEAEEMERRSINLNDLDFKLRDREKQLDQKENNLNVKTQGLDSEQKRLDSILEETKLKEAALIKIDIKKEELQTKIDELKDNEEGIKKQLDELSEQKKEFKTLEERSKELDHREALLKKEMLSDAHRKDILETSEKELNLEKERFQKIADQISAMKLKMNIK